MCACVALHALKRDFVDVLDLFFHARKRNFVDVLYLLLHASERSLVDRFQQIVNIVGRPGGSFVFRLGLF